MFPFDDVIMEPVVNILSFTFASFSNVMYCIELWTTEMMSISKLLLYHAGSHENVYPASTIYATFY